MHRDCGCRAGLKPAPTAFTTAFTIFVPINRRVWRKCAPQTAHAEQTRRLPSDRGGFQSRPLPANAVQRPAALDARKTKTIKATCDKHSFCGPPYELMNAHQQQEMRSEEIPSGFHD